MSARKSGRNPSNPQTHNPSLRDQLRPVELLGIAAVIGVFVGLVSLLATREPILAVIMFGVAFIVVLVVLAMFVLGFKPDSAEKEDLAEQDRASGTDRDSDAGGPASTVNPHD